MSSLALVLLCAGRLGADDGAASAPAAPAPAWNACASAIPWRHAAEVPNTELRLMELVGAGGFTKFSAEWIDAAIKAAPPLDDLLDEARRDQRLLFWYVPATVGQHMILPHLLDRYMTTGPLSDPEVIDVVRRRYVALKLPAGGALARRFHLEAPAFVEPGVLVLDADGEVVARADRISTFSGEWLAAFLRDAAGEPATPGSHDDAKSRDPLERGRARLAAGRFADAESALAAPIAPDVPRERAAEIGYRRGVALYFLRREDDARAAWRETLAEFPNTLFAAKAAACAELGADERLGESPLTRSMLDPRALPAAAPRGKNCTDTSWRRTPDDAADVARRALDFLLLEQRSNGSWPGPRWGGGPDGGLKHENLEKSIAAVACAAIRSWRALDPAAADAALARGEDYLLDDSKVVRGDEVAWVYADGYRLFHFARRLPDLSGERRERVLDAMKGWVHELEAQQRTLGGPFRHFIAYSSTFATAAVLACLADARDAGVAVDADVLSGAAAALEKTRGGELGLFGYLIDNPEVTRTSLGAGNRQPLCIHALWRLHRADEAELAHSLELFDASYDRSADLARKTNFHVPSLDHTAGYFFFHNFFPAAEVARALGDRGKDARRSLLAKLCALPEVDGSFIDAGFSYGKSYSTAMALLSLAELLDR